MQQTNLWAEYYKYNGPYCSKKHRETSYNITYAELASYLNSLSIPEQSNLIDIGAGTLDQFSLVPELQKFNWHIVEPSLTSNSTHPCVKEIGQTIQDILPNKKIEIACMLSVTQYLKEEELKEYINLLMQKLPKLHTIIISDVIIGRTSQIKDLLVYLLNSIRFGYLLRGLIHLLKLRFGEYSVMRKNLPLRSYSISQLENICTTNGLKLKIKRRNLGYNFHRKTFVITKDL
jgi:hypothetical protein